MTPEYTKSLMECIKAYTQLGWRVLPLCYPVGGKCTCGRNCENPGKSPHYRLAPNGSKGATVDEKQINKWFESGEKFNIGICAGPESGLVIVDIDPRHGGMESIKMLIKNPIQTPKVITGSGGGHLYFKHPGGEVRNSAGTVAPGIDVRGTNGYVVAPPSMHACGNAYRWRIDARAELADMPKWVSKKQKKQAANPTDGDAIPDGQRDDTLAQIAGKLRRFGLDAESIYIHLKQIKCDPPKTDDDLLRIANSVARYEPDPIASSDGIQIKDSHPDTIAKLFEKESVYKHKYHPHDGWSMYKDGQYQRIDEEKQLARYVSELMGKCIYKDGKKIKRVSLTNRAIKDAIQQTSYLPSVYLLPRQGAPCWLDPAGGGKRVIPLQNGLLDWSEWPFRLIDHTPDYYTLNYLPFDWDGDITSDLWDGYLADVTNNDPELMLLIQQWAGYCLLKHDHKQQKFMLIYGESSTGKSVYADVLTHLVGLPNVSTVPLELFSEPHMITQTWGKMLNISDESEECMLEASVENALKHYTGGTMFPFKELYKAPFSAYPTAKVMITTNHKPKFKDSSDGIWRRMLFAPFEVVVKNVVLGLQDIIIRDEMPGVLAWALRGAMDLEKRGTFITPEISRTSLEDYKNEMHPERSFLSDNFEYSENPDDMLQCKSVRKAYERWTSDNNYGVKNETNFGKSVKKVFPKTDRLRASKGGQRAYFYRNLRVKTESEFFNLVIGLE